jgi:hypothetical protein
VKTKSGIYVEVAERPGTVEISVQYALHRYGSGAPCADEPRDAESSAHTLFRVICGLAENLPPKDAVFGSVVAGPRPGWSLTLKPLGAKRVADGLKPISSILTVEEARTLRGLLASARRWVEHPPMLTYVDGGRLTRSQVTRRSLAALRAAPTAAPATDASEGDPDLRLARPVVHDPGHERVWEPCKSTDDGAVLVVLP